MRFLVGLTLPRPGLALRPALELEEGLLLPRREEGPASPEETVLLSCSSCVRDRCSSMLVS